MKKKERNLLYPIPIAEVNEARLKDRISTITGQPVEKIDRFIAAQYKGILDSMWDLRKLGPITNNGMDITYVVPIIHVNS